MKYRDYLILPVLIMYLLYTSCAYIAKTDEAASVGKKAVPDAAVNPASMIWGGDEGEYGELWYASGALMTRGKNLLLRQFCFGRCHRDDGVLLRDFR